MSTQDQAAAPHFAQRKAALAIAICAVWVMSLFAVAAIKESIDYGIYTSKCK